MGTAQAWRMRVTPEFKSQSSHVGHVTSAPKASVGSIYKWGRLCPSLPRTVVKGKRDTSLLGLAPSRHLGTLVLFPPVGGLRLLRAAEEAEWRIEHQLFSQEDLF